MGQSQIRVPNKGRWAQDIKLLHFVNGCSNLLMYTQFIYQIYQKGSYYLIDIDLLNYKDPVFYRC